MSNECTALAKAMEPLFPRWKPGDLLKLARIWFWHEKLLEDAMIYGLLSEADVASMRAGSYASQRHYEKPEKDGVML
jgi:hypothetical protein